MKKGDELALQHLFKELIALSKTTNAPEDLKVGGKSLFSIYSHDGYTSITKDHPNVNVMKNGSPVEVNTNTDVESTEA